MVVDGIGEAQDLAMLLVRYRSVRKLLVAVQERTAKAAKAISVSRNSGMLTAIQMLADLSRCMDLVVEKGDEGGDGALEVDVVFPKGVVGVYE